VDAQHVRGRRREGVAGEHEDGVALLDEPAGLQALFARGRAVTPGGEICDPSRTVPRGLLGGTAFLIALYCSVQLVSQGVLGPSVVQYGGAPLVAVRDVRGTPRVDLGMHPVSSDVEGD
jgi:hypothetical protein